MPKLNTIPEDEPPKCNNTRAQPPNLGEQPSPRHEIRLHDVLSASHIVFEVHLLNQVFSKFVIK